MLAGERGADYVMFGEPIGGWRPPFESVVERIGWWADVFEVPCVGHAPSREEVRRLATAGADFVAVEYIWDDPHGAAAAVAEAARNLSAAEAIA
jgi:thiamine-phosphate pyrophosphorylase